MATLAQVVVGMAEIQIANDATVLTCLGLGSCIGLAAFDPATRITGMVHIMLPEAFPGKPVDKPGKFADTGIPEMLRLLTIQGANPGRLIFAYSGGAQVFKFGSNPSGRLDIGNRNADAVKNALAVMRARVLAFDVGGSSGRTMTVDGSTGIVRVKTVQGTDRELCAFRGVAA